MNTTTRSLAALLLCTLACLAQDNACIPDWPMFMGNAQRTGVYPGQLKLPVQRAWSTALGSAAVGSPIVGNGIVYVGTADGRLVALGAEDGVVLWTAALGAPLAGSALLAGDRVVAATQGAGVLCVESATGKTIWRAGVGTTCSTSPLADADLIMCATSAPKAAVVAFKDDGTVAWEVPVSAAVTSEPSIEDSRLFVAVPGTALAIDTRKGAIEWDHAFLDGAFSRVGLTVRNGEAMVAPGNYDRGIHGVSSRSGRSINAHQWVLPRPVAAPVSLIREALRQRPERQRTLIAKALSANATLSKTLSSDGFIAYGEIFTSTPAVAGQEVFVTQMEAGYPLPRYTMLAVSWPRGKQLWRIQQIDTGNTQGYCSSPVVWGDNVIGVLGEQTLSILNRSSGKTLWQQAVDAPVLGSPALYDNKIVLADQGGTVSAFAGTGSFFRPSAFGLAPGYPNPFRRTTTIKYMIPRPCRLAIDLFSAKGRLVAQLVNDRKAPGYYSVQWDGRDGNHQRAASGMYLVRMTTHGYAKSVKVFLVR